MTYDGFPLVISLLHESLAKRSVIVCDDAIDGSMGSVRLAVGLVIRASQLLRCRSESLVTTSLLNDLHFVVDAQSPVSSCIGRTLTQDNFIESCEVIEGRLLIVATFFSDCLPQRLAINGYKKNDNAESDHCFEFERL